MAWCINSGSCPRRNRVSTHSRGATGPVPHVRCGREGWVGNFVPVEMQDRQHGTVGRGIEELIGMPGRGQGSGLRLAITDDAGDDEIGIVEHRPKGMAE